MPPPVLPHNLRSHLTIHETIEGIDKKPDLLVVVCRSPVAEFVEPSSSNFLWLYRDESVDSHRGAAITECYAPTFDVNLSGHLNYCTTSTTADFCGIRLALQGLLHLQVPSKAVILTDSRAALSSLTNKITVTLPMRLFTLVRPLKMLGEPYIFSGYG